MPKRADQPLAVSMALPEAEELLLDIDAQRIAGTGDASGWIIYDASSGSPTAAQPGMVYGTTGIGLFACALAGLTDRLLGLSGLIGTLVRFPELLESASGKTVLRRAAERLMALRGLTEGSFPLFRPCGDRLPAASLRGAGADSLRIVILALSIIRTRYRQTHLKHL